MTAPTILSRAAWGFSGWRGTTYHVDLAARDYFFNHYYGNKMPEQYRLGVALPKHIDALHKANGWVGIGYGYVIDLDGVAYEGRGWSLVGAHCPNFNTRGMSVMYAVGGDQKLTDAQKATGRWFRERHAASRGDKILTTVVHGDRYPTSCAGDASVNPWVHGGMLLPLGPASPIPSLPPVPQPAPVPPVVIKPSFKLSVDGRLGRNTISALQTRLRAAGMRGLDNRPLAIDGINGKNTTAALQRYLNAKLAGPDLLVDGMGFKQENNYKSKTNAALQRWLATPIDGTLSSPISVAVKRMQDRLNRGNF
jgi:hypothetical protein